MEYVKSGYHLERKATAVSVSGVYRARYHPVYKPYSKKKKGRSDNPILKATLVFLLKGAFHEIIMLARLLEIRLLLLAPRDAKSSYAGQFATIALHDAGTL